MLKTNKGAKSTDLLKTLSAKISQFAILSGLVIRQSKSFKPEVFLLALLQVVSQGKSSYNNIAMEMGEVDSQCSNSAQSLWKRMARKDCNLEMFLGKCMALFCSQNTMKSQVGQGVFTRILTEDSSFVKMLKSCADLFPAHGNAYGKTAGLKLNLIFDLLTGETLEASTHNGTQQDRRLAWDVLGLLQKGDLVLRDMGYFVVDIFSKIEAKGAHWLSRLPQAVTVTLTHNQEPLEDWLERSTEHVIETQVELTDSKKRARIIAVRKSEEVANESVRKLKELARKKGKQPSRKALVRARWHLLVTSVPEEMMSAKDLCRLYAQRWQIEIIFKSWKQAGHLERSLAKKSSYKHLLGIFLIEVLKLVIIMHSYQQLRKISVKWRERLSISKLSEWITKRIQRATKLTHIGNATPNPTHILTQKRARNFQLMSLLELLG